MNHETGTNDATNPEHENVAEGDAANAVDTGDTEAGNSASGEPANTPDVAADPVDAVAHATLQAERDRLEDQLRRAMTDLASIRKRHAKEMVEARDRAKGDLAHELLPVLDNFEFALQAHEQATGTGGPADGAAAVIQGVEMVRGLLTDTLGRHGLAEIPSLGETFDPNHHEAVGVDPTGDREPGTITQVAQRGYRLGERVLRPSKVLVAGERPEGS